MLTLTAVSLHIEQWNTDIARRIPPEASQNETKALRAAASAISTIKESFRLDGIEQDIFSQLTHCLVILDRLSTLVLRQSFIL